MKIILASKSGVRRQILQNNINFDVVHSNVDEDIKESFLSEGADPNNIKKFSRIKSCKSK